MAKNGRTGALDFSANQVYPFTAQEAPTLAEETAPEAADQKALVDDEQSARAYTSVSDNKKNGILGAVLVIVAVAFIMGVVKR